MLVIGNVPTGLAIGPGGRVGRVMSGRILDGGFAEFFLTVEEIFLK